MPLARDQVLQGALALLDQAGFDGLTMRRLATTLGVQAGAIYWHFANKQALVDAMAEKMLDGLLEPPLAGPWDAQLGELSRRLATAFLRWRDGARLATQALQPGANSLQFGETLLAILQKAGVSKQRALWAAAAIGYYVLGYVIDLQATEAAKARGLMSVARAIKKRIDRKKYPLIWEMQQKPLEELLSSREARARFEFGLQVILRGLKGARRRER
jgi:TetR/AcrR family tetracycline transcriptional repressor